MGRVRRSLGGTNALGVVRVRRIEGLKEHHTISNGRGVVRIMSI